MGPVESIKSCLSQYAVFSGRASRSEFFWFWILTSLAVALLSRISFGDFPLQNFGVIFWLWSLVPGLAVASRRMRDSGQSVATFLAGAGILFLLSNFGASPFLNDLAEITATDWAIFAVYWGLFFWLFWMASAPSVETREDHVFK